MSHKALQRALVTALYDAKFLGDAKARPELLAELTDEERDWLMNTDPRALRVDADRGVRLLRAVAGELPASLALAASELSRANLVDEFFSSNTFRQAIREDQTLVLAYAAHLGGLRIRNEWFGDVLRLETTRAQCRRARSRRVAGVALAPGVTVAEFDSMVLEVVQRLEKHLFEITLVPQLMMVRERTALPVLPRASGELLHLLFQRGGDGFISLVPVDADLARVLECFRMPQTLAAARAVLTAKLIPAQAVDGLIDSLRNDGLLVADEGQAAPRGASELEVEP